VSNSRSGSRKGGNQLLELRDPFDELLKFGIPLGRCWWQGLSWPVAWVVEAWASAPSRFLIQLQLMTARCWRCRGALI
jgi:hypothetical protein